MKYFVTADVHGFFDEWMRSLDECGFDINNPDHKIIVCGDLFDRGRQPKQIIDFVREHRDRMILVRGNHEDLMDEMIERGGPLSHDLANGTVRTIAELCRDWLTDTSIPLEKIAEESGLKEVIDSTIDYYETEHYVFVHAWIPTLVGAYLYDACWRYATPSAWRRARWANPVEMAIFEIFDEKRIVFGHWHVSAFWHREDPDRYEPFGPNARFDPYFHERYIALDGCASYSGKVNVIVIDD